MDKHTRANQAGKADSTSNTNPMDDSASNQGRNANSAAPQSPTADKEIRLGQTATKTAGTDRHDVKTDTHTPKVGYNSKHSKSATKTDAVTKSYMGGASGKDTATTARQHDDKRAQVQDAAKDANNFPLVHGTKTGANDKDLAGTKHATNPSQDGKVQAIEKTRSIDSQNIKGPGSPDSPSIPQGKLPNKSALSTSEANATGVMKTKTQIQIEATDKEHVKTTHTANSKDDGGLSTDDQKNLPGLNHSDRTDGTKKKIMVQPSETQKPEGGNGSVASVTNRSSTDVPAQRHSQNAKPYSAEKGEDYSVSNQITLPVVYQYMQAYHSEELKDLQETYHTILEETITSEQTVVTLKGKNEIDVKNAEGQFLSLYQKLATTIKTETFDMTCAPQEKDAKVIITIVNGKVEISGPDDDRKLMKAALRERTILNVPQTRQDRSLQKQPSRSDSGGTRCLDLSHIASGIKVLVYEADITTLSVDVIVNAANGRLKHGSGVAGAIAKAAGHTLREECDAFIKRNGPLQTANVTMTDAGNLPCLKVIHAVGPVWKGLSNREACLEDLYLTYRNCFAKAKKFKSVAIPAISSGVFSVPKEGVSTSLCKALFDICQTAKKKKVPTATLR